jgi:hypothetical protein
MMQIVAQYVIKGLVTGALVFLAASLCWQAFRIWFGRTLVLTPFDYLDDGKPSVETGEQFARMVRMDLAEVARLYNVGRAANPAAVTATDGGASEPMTMPAKFDSIFDSIELKAYGIEFGSIFKSLRRTIEAPSEITGSVTDQGDEYAVFAEMRRPGEPVRRWNVQYAKNMPEATRNIACRIFRALAGAPESKTMDAPLFRAVDDEDFCLFSHALAAYDQYRARKAIAPDDAAKLLSDAETALRNLQNRDVVAFPYVHKLAAIVFFEQKSYADAAVAIDHYINWLNKNPERSDTSALTLRDKIESEKVQRTPAVTKLRPLRPGSSIGSLDSKGAGMICCIVRDGDGRRYLLSALRALGGVSDGRIVQPAVVDGGTEKDVVAVVARATTTAAIARIDEDIGLDPRVLELGTIQGIASNPAVDQVVITYGYDGMRREGTIVSTSSSLDVTDPETGAKLTVQNPIITSDISPDRAVGAPVFTTDGKLVGMVYGVGGPTTLVLPIEQILDELDVELVK